MKSSDKGFQNKHGCRYPESATAIINTGISERGSVSIWLSNCTFRICDFNSELPSYFLFEIMAVLCICGEQIYPRHHQVQCDACKVFRHRKCNSGMNVKHFLFLRKTQPIPTFVCPECRGDQTEGVREKTTVDSSLCLYCSRKLTRRGQSVACIECRGLTHRRCLCGKNQNFSTRNFHTYLKVKCHFCKLLTAISNEF